MNIYLLILAAVALVIAVGVRFLLLKLAGEDENELRRREERAIQEEEKSAARAELSRKVSDFALRFFPISFDKMQQMQNELRRAGLKMDVGSYWALRVCSVLIGVVIGLVVASLVRTTFMYRFLIVVGCAAFTAFVPRFMMLQRMRRRNELIEASLPGMLELLAVVVGAGQTVDRGIKTIATCSTGPLAEEFAQVDLNITSFGYSVSDALRKMSERVGLPSVSLFCASVIQSIEAGSSVGDELKSQAKIATDNYYMAIEEKSNKIRTKMILPTVFFILPPVFIITLTPMVMNLMTILPQILNK